MVLRSHGADFKVALDGGGVVKYVRSYCCQASDHCHEKCYPISGYQDSIKCLPPFLQKEQSKTVE